MNLTGTPVRPSEEKGVNPRLDNNIIGNSGLSQADRDAKVREDRVTEIGQAIVQGREDDALALLRKGPITLISRNFIMRNAANRGALQIVAYFLEQTGLDPFSDAQRGSYVVLAAQRGYLPVIEKLLANGPITKDDRQSAIQQAFAARHELVADKL